MRSHLLTALLLLFVAHARAYDIQGSVTGLKGGKCLLGSYYATPQAIFLDTARVDAKGAFVFHKNRDLARGMYFVQLPNKTKIDFCYKQENSLSFSTELGQINIKMTWQNAPDNANYYNLLKSLEGQSAEKVSTLKYNYYASNNAAMICRWLKAQDGVGVPVEIAYKNGKLDSTSVFKYNKEHYFDNLNLNEDFLLNTAFLEEKLLFYLQKMTYPVSDSILVASDRIMNLASSKIQKYLAIKLTQLYENPPFIGGDQVYIGAIDRYYTGRPQLWEPSVVAKMTEKATLLRPLLVGQIIPDVVVTDDKGLEKRLYDVKSPITILYIYSLDCPHCKEHAPKLAAFQQKMASKGVKVFAVAMERDLPRWKKFISTYHTENLMNGLDVHQKYDLNKRYNVVEFPMNYILDDQKKIIGKRINPDLFEAYINFIRNKR